MKAKNEGGIKIITENRKAGYAYHFIEKFEAGIVLTGPEIKSIRSGKVSIAESYVRPQGDSLYLINAHINPYTFSDTKVYDPIRQRKLLMHRREIEKLRGKVEQQGLTIVPLKIYLKNGFAKIEIALAKGKDIGDKRQTIKERESKREIAREIKRGK